MIITYDIAIFYVKGYKFLLNERHSYLHIILLYVI